MAADSPGPSGRRGFALLSRQLFKQQERIFEYIRFHVFLLGAHPSHYSTNLIHRHIFSTILTCSVCVKKTNCSFFLSHCPKLVFPFPVKSKTNKRKNPFPTHKLSPCYVPSVCLITFASCYYVLYLLRATGC